MKNHWIIYTFFVDDNNGTLEVELVGDTLFANYRMTPVFLTGTPI